VWRRVWPLLSIVDHSSSKFLNLVKWKNAFFFQFSIMHGTSCCCLSSWRKFHNKICCFLANISSSSHNSLSLYVYILLHVNTEKKSNERKKQWTRQCNAFHYHHIMQYLLLLNKKIKILGHELSERTLRSKKNMCFEQSSLRLTRLKLLQCFFKVSNCIRRRFQERKVKK
jgi:hypothetical protein